MSTESPRKATLGYIAVLMILVIIGIFTLIFVKSTRIISNSGRSTAGSSLQFSRFVNLGELGYKKADNRHG